MSRNWDDRKTPETRKVEAVFRAEFPQTEAYRFNSASIRVRIVDECFQGMSMSDREDLVFPVLNRLPKRTRDDVLVLLMLAPEEFKEVTGQTLMNLEFEEARPSRL